MIDHLTMKVRDFEKAKAFYAAALRPIGYRVMMEYGTSAGLGAGKPDFWLAADPEGVHPMHIAFTAKDRGAVDAFHAAALAAGATDNGKPGIRADYSPTYYAAFVHDPDGHNVEVVCHAPPGAGRTAAKRAKRASPRKAGPSRGKAKARRRRA